MTDSVSTRFIGEFPSTIDNINDLLMEATKSIIIFEDVLAYGIYSNPEGFHKYMKIIEKKAIDDNNIDIHIVVYNSKLVNRTRQVQHIGPKHIDRYCDLRKAEKHSEARNLRDSVFRENINNKKRKFDFFLNYDFSDTKGMKNNYSELNKIKRQLKNINIDSLTYKQYDKMLIKLSNNVKERFDKQNAIRIDTVANMHIMNCWVIDRKKAIFGYVGNLSSNEIAFITQDKTIIDYITNMADNVNDLRNDPYGEYHDYDDVE